MGGVIDSLKTSGLHGVYFHGYSGIVSIEYAHTMLVLYMYMNTCHVNAD